MSKTRVHLAAGDWDVIMRLLPRGWEARARELGALRRTRGITDAATLLRVLLIHLVGGCSLVETALRAEQAGLCSISPVAVFKRLRAAEQWLRWLAEQFWRQHCGACEMSGRRARVVDATVVSEAGPTGSQWRVHYAIDLASLQCDFFELTDVHGGETFRRLPVRAGDLVLGDRGYSRAPGIAYVVKQGGDVLVRVHVQSLPLFTASGRRVALLSRLRGLKVGQIGEWPAFVHGPDGALAGRLMAIKRSPASAERVRQRMKRRARHKQHGLSAAAVETAGYVLLWTTLPKSKYAARFVLEMYRWRWQIELAIKRMKSILGLGQLPKRTDASSHAWLHGKLFAALLLEQLWREAESLSPWGYPLADTPQPLARDEVPAA